jgi:hypothetical protein
MSSYATGLSKLRGLNLSNKTSGYDALFMEYSVYRQLAETDIARKASNPAPVDKWPPALIQTAAEVVAVLESI